MNKKYASIFALLITLLIASNVLVLQTIFKPKREQVIVQRVIDGDTLILENGEHIRLLNINAPEKDHPISKKATAFLKQFENKTVEIEKTQTDKYGRTLARLYAPEYLNLEEVQNGLASKFLVDQNELKDFYDAEENAIQNAQGIWQHAEKYGCITVTVNAEKEIARFTSHCEEINIANWVVKDESRKEYKFGNIALTEINLHSNSGTNNATDVYWNAGKDVWNNDRDTLYLFDDKYNIAAHDAYGY